METGDSIEDFLVEIPNVTAQMEAGHGQIAPDRMEYLLFQGDYGEELIMILNKLVDYP